MAVASTNTDYETIQTKDYVIQFLLFWVLGLINNIGGVVVLSAAKSVSESFNKAHLIGAISWANTSLGLFAKMINVGYLLNIRTSVKMTANAIIMLIGTVLTAAATKISFELCIVGILFIGISSALGESVLLGYFKHYQPRLVGSWSSGTGAAGLFGTGLYLLLKSVLKLSNFKIYMIMIPLSFIYYSSFVYLHRTYGPGASSRPQSDADSFQSPLLDPDTDLSDTGEAIDMLHPRKSSVSSHLSLSRTTFFFKGAHAHSVDSNPQYPDGSHGDHDTIIPPGSNPLLQRQPSSVSSHTHPHHQSVTFGGSLDTPFMLETDDISFGDDAIASTPGNNGHETNDTKLDPYDQAPHPPISLQPETIDLDDPTDDPSSMGSLNALNDDHPDDHSQLLSECHDDSEGSNANGFCARSKRVFPIVGSSGLQLMAVYFLEYVVIVGYASHANPKTQNMDWFHENAYEVLSVMYQIGVFISRSSISLLHIHRVEFLTLLQAANFTLWMMHALYHFISPIAIQFVCMVFVGLIAGAMYVNVFHNIQKNQHLGDDKEFAINLVSICVNVGITFSSIFTLVADATFLKGKKDN